MKKLDNLIKEKIQIELEKINFDFSYKGTKLLAETIYECYIEKVKYGINLSQEIYPIISKKYGIDANSIKVYIFYSISKMYDIVNKNDLFDFLKYKVLYRPKSKEIIFTVLEKLNQL